MEAGHPSHGYSGAALFLALLSSGVSAPEFPTPHLQPTPQWAWAWARPQHEEEPFQPELPKYCGGLLVPFHGDGTLSGRRRRACLCQAPVGAVPIPATMQETGWLTQAGVANVIQMKLQGQLGLRTPAFLASQSVCSKATLSTPTREAAVFPTQMHSLALSLSLHPPSLKNSSVKV